MFGKTKYVPVPVPDFGDSKTALAVVKQFLEKDEVRHYLRQRVAIAAAQMPIYMKSQSQEKVVPMLAGKIEELSYLLDTAVRDIGSQIAPKDVEPQAPPIAGRFTDRIREDISD